MKKITTVVFLLIYFLSNAQQTLYPYSAGQRYILDIGNTTIISNKQATGGKIGYRNHVEVVDTIFYIPATAPDDTIATLLAAADAIHDTLRPAILLQEGSTRRASITIPRPNMYIGSYDGGDGSKPVIDGADVVTGMTISTTGLRSGIELVTNGTFNTSVRSWVRNLATTDTTWVSGKARLSIPSTTFGNVRNSPALALEVGQKYRVTVKISNNTGQSGFRITNSSFTTVYQINSAAANTTLTTDFTATTNPSYIYLTIENTGTSCEFDDVTVQKLDYNIWQKADITNQPNLMYLNDIAGTLQTSIVNCDTLGQWYWDDATDIFYVYSLTNPSGTVELGQRGNLIYASSKNYITLKNLTVQHCNSTATQSGGAYFIGGEYLSVNNCIFQDNLRTGLYTNNSNSIIIDGNTFTRNGVIYNNGSNYIHWSNITEPANLVFKNNISSYAGVNGCYIYTNGMSTRISNIEISGNTFRHNKAAGAYPQRCDTVAVFSNTFDSNGAEDHNYNITDEDYAFGSEGCNYVDFYNNTITNQFNNDAVQFYADINETSHNSRIFNNYIQGVTNGHGIAIIANGNNTFNNCIVAYNVINDVEKNGINLFGYNATSTSSVNIFNNTIYSYDWFGIDITEFFPAVVKNNIFSNGGTCIRKQVGTLLTTSNNLWNIATGNVLIYGAFEYTMANITDFEATAQTGNPLFTNAATGDFTLQAGSPAINAGVDVGLTHDILGNEIEGLPDIGAIEYKP